MYVVAVPVSLLSLPKSSSISPVERPPLKTLRRTPNWNSTAAMSTDSARRLGLSPRRPGCDERLPFFLARLAIPARLLSDLGFLARRHYVCIRPLNCGGRRSVSFRYDMTNASATWIDRIVFCFLLNGLSSTPRSRLFGRLVLGVLRRSSSVGSAAYPNSFTREASIR